MSTSYLDVDSVYRPQSTPMHALDPTVKLVCALTFVLAVAATPARAVWAFAVYMLLVAVAAGFARIPIATMSRRMLIELPFVLFALALPFISAGPRLQVGPMALSEAGSWAAWGIIAKGTLGAAVCVVLSWSTPAAGLLDGFDHLRAPRALTAIAGFMIRYIDVVAGELHRLQIARISRGDDPRSLGQVRAVGATIGCLFVRSFERGERVQQSMLARGFDGHFPPTRARDASRTWWPSAAWPTAAAAVAVVAILHVS